MNGGSISIEQPIGELGPNTRARAFAETSLGRAAAMRLEGMRTRFLWDTCMSKGKSFRVEAIFEGERLQLVELCLNLPHDKAGWDGWTQAGERQRKEDGESWIAAMFGKKAEILPIEVDGKEIMPFEAKWDSLRGAKFSWGIVKSYFDSKAGFAGIRIEYALPQV